MPAEIAIRVQVFASLREDLGRGVIELTLPAGSPVGAVWGHLPEPVSRTVPPAGLRYALNDVWTLPAATLEHGDTVALVLPVSGG